MKKPCLKKKKLFLAFAALVLALGVFLLAKYIMVKRAGAGKLMQCVGAVAYTVLGALGCLSQLDQCFTMIPVLQVGIPAVFSVYFDLFSSAMQAFIFCMLTTLYIANAAEE